jgi:hypothetical protein
MGLTAAIVTLVGLVSAALGALRILNVPSTPILSDKLTWPFWMALAVVLLLTAIVLMLGRQPGGGGADD